VRCGDLVIAYDETTGQTAPKPITALIRPLPKAVMDVEVAGANGAVERVGVTADHPWLVVRGEGALEWVQTLDLKPGDRLVTADGRGATVRAATLRDGFVQTTNLEVADFQTFLVGKDGVVVHNAGWCKGTFSSVRDSILYHFGKHGGAVVAATPSQYANMARNMARNLGALQNSGPRADGTTRYWNSQNFIIMRGNSIVSFGKK
jgi:hypothetical protein